MSEQLITTYEREQYAQEQAYVRGIYAERERIIELLETYELDSAVKLIEGETDNEN